MKWYRTKRRRALVASLLGLLAPLLWAAPASANDQWNIRLGYGCSGGFSGAGWSYNAGWGTWNNPDTLCGGGSLWTYPNGSTASSHLKWWAYAPCGTLFLQLAVDVPTWDANYTHAHYTIADGSGHVLDTLYINQAVNSGDYNFGSLSVPDCQTITVTLDDLGTYVNGQTVIGGADVYFHFTDMD